MSSACFACVTETLELSKLAHDVGTAGLKGPNYHASTSLWYILVISFAQEADITPAAQLCSK